MPQNLQSLKLLCVVKLISGDANVKDWQYPWFRSVIRFLDLLSGRKVIIVDTPSFDDLRVQMSPIPIP